MVTEPTRAALNASQYGTGKTLVTVEVAGRLGVDVKLIVAPLFTKYSWLNTIKGQYPDDPVHFINATKKGKVALHDMLEGVPGWYIIGREYFNARSVREQLEGKPSEVIDFLAYDECAAWANRKSIGFKHMMKVKPGYKMALSATPYANKFQNMWSIARWLWGDLAAPRSFWNWVKEWCVTEELWYGNGTTTVVVGERERGAFVASLPCYVRLEKDFGDPIEDKIEIDLSPKERRIYDEFEKYLIVWLGENPLIVKFPITKRLRLRQMTLGEVAVDLESDTVFFPEDMKSTKYDTLVQYLKEHPEPAIIFTDSAQYAAVVTYRLIEDGFKAMEWSGRIPEDIRHGVKDAFVDGQIDYIVATIPSIGEGVDGLQHRARLMIWLSRSDNNMLNMQAFRRLYRRGQKHQVVSIDIEARNTYDSGQLSSLIQQSLAVNESLKKGNT